MVLAGRASLINGTSGTQPWNTVVRGNVAHELGLFNKQAAALFMALAARTVVQCVAVRGGLCGRVVCFLCVVLRIARM